MTPHDRPTASELVEAVREYLERDVVGATEGRVQFHARVAANALRMVERELSGGSAMDAAHDRRLSSLGFRDDRALADAIREGALDDRWDDVRRVVFDSVVDKLRVANPDHLEADEGQG